MPNYWTKHALPKYVDFQRDRPRVAGVRKTFSDEYMALTDVMRRIGQAIVGVDEYVQPDNTSLGRKERNGRVYWRILGGFRGFEVIKGTNKGINPLTSIVIDVYNRTAKVWPYKIEEDWCWDGHFTYYHTHTPVMNQVPDSLMDELQTSMQPFLDLISD